jgi:nucleotide-binding universal stress UspA family protein
MHTIIVGVDGSAGGDAALQFAAEEARMRNARLRVVSVWELAPTWSDPPGGDLVQGLRAPADAAVRAAW